MKRINQVGLLFVFALFLISGVSHFLLTRFFSRDHAALSAMALCCGLRKQRLRNHRRDWIGPSSLPPRGGHRALCPDHSRDAGQYSYGAQSRAIPRFFHKPVSGALWHRWACCALIYAVAIQRLQRKAPPNGQGTNGL